MTDDRDPFRALAEADPARSAPSFDPRSPRGREVLERALTSTGSTGATGIGSTSEVAARRGRRRRTLIAVTAAVAVTGAAAAAAFVDRRNATRTLSVGCFGDAALQTRIYSVSATEQTAVDRCWRLWRTGKFAPTPTPDRLVPCLLESGSVGVFPGGPEVCARLGRPLAPIDARSDPSVSALSDRLVDAVAGQDCASPDSLRQTAQTAFEEFDLAGWRVGVSPGPGFTPERPCAVFTIDEPGQQVLLVPVERRRPPS